MMKGMGHGRLPPSGVTLQVDLHPEQQADELVFTTLTCEKHGSVDIGVNRLACSARIARDKLGNVDVDVVFLAERH